MFVRIFFAFSLCVLTLNSWAVNKCKGPDGKIVFQDRPCEGQGEALVVRPASGAAPPATAPSARGDSSANGSAGQSGDAPKGNKYEQQLAKAQDERERRDKWFAMRNAGQALDRQVAQCEQDQRRIASQKAYSKNNLAGATWDVSISNEMQAAAALCSEKVKLAQSRLESARATCDRIKCIPAVN